MARSISVYRKSDVDFVRTAPQDLCSAEFDIWCEEANALCLYNAAFGSEATVRENWTEIAQKLNLPLLASLYEKGFYEGIEWSEDEFDDLAQELRAIEQIWANIYHDQNALLRQLRESAASLRTAIEIAREHNGVIDIR